MVHFLFLFFKEHFKLRLSKGVGSTKRLLFTLCYRAVPKRVPRLHLCVHKLCLDTDLFTLVEPLDVYITYKSGRARCVFSAYITLQPTHKTFYFIFQTVMF